MKENGTTSDKEWQLVTTSANKSQRVTTSYKECQRFYTNRNEWQQMKVSSTNKENKWEWEKQNAFKFQNETKGQSSSWIVLFNFSCNV